MTPEFEGLGLSELLDLLEPVPVPDRVSMMPQTVAWLWLGLAVLAGLTVLAWWIWRHWRAGAYRRAALADLALAGQDPAKLAAILRRTALAAYPRAQVAGLHGARWLTFLDQSYGGQDFSNGPGRLVAVAPWRSVSAPDPALTGLVEVWIRKHQGVTH